MIYISEMKLRVLLAVFSLVAAACTGEVIPPTSTAVQTTTTGPPISNTSTSVGITTSTIGVPEFPVLELPVEGECDLGDASVGGEATVLVGGRLYGLGADDVTPRCLLDDVASLDVVWGPMADRLRSGNEVVLGTERFAVGAASGYEWTAPAGSSLVAYSGTRLWKIAVDDQSETDVTFLADTVDVAYHPSGEHLLALGTDPDGQYGLWLATNQGTDPLLLAFDEGATMFDPAWTWLGEPVFAAEHNDGSWHIHRVDITAEGGLDGPIIVESDVPIDMLTPSPFDPIMLAYRMSGMPGVSCVDGAHVAVSNVDVPEPLNQWTTTPVGWLSGERLLVLAYPEGCEGSADLWSFSPGFCPGSVYGVFPMLREVDGAAAREPFPLPPPPPDFTGIIDPAPA